MIRIVKSGNKYYGVEFKDFDDGVENIQVFAEEGSPVLIIDEIEDALEFGLTPDEIEMVD